MDPKQDQECDGVDIQGVEGQDAVRFVRPEQQSPEGQRNRGRDQAECNRDGRVQQDSKTSSSGAS